LFEVDPGLNWKNAGVRLLAKEVLRPLRSTSVLEEGEGPKYFFLVAGELLRGQAQIQSAGVEEGLSGALFSGEVGGRGVRATGAQDSRRILSYITVCNYDTTYL